MFVILLSTCQKFVSKVFNNNINNNNDNNNNNNNDNNSNDNKVEEIVLPRILQYSFLSIVQNTLHSSGEVRLKSSGMRSANYVC